jgi:hypothetical protein
VSRVVSLVAAFALAASAASGQSLGSAGNFGVLGATTVTNTGASVVTGDLGVSPGTAVTGFLPAPANTVAGPGTVTPGPGVVSGTIRPGGMVAAAAHADAFMAGEALKMMACPPANNLTGQNLGGLVLPPGVYCFSSSAQLTGIITLTGTGPWVFKIGSTLTTASLSAIFVPDVTTACDGANVFWQVGSSATLGTRTQFVGNIVAETSVTLTTGASVSGSVLAVNAAVTMDTNAVTACGHTPPPPPPTCEPCKCKSKHKHHHHRGDRDGEHHHGDDDGHRGHKDDCDDDHGHDHDGNGHDKGRDKGRENDNGNGRSRR